MKNEMFDPELTAFHGTPKKGITSKISYTERNG